MVQGKLSIVVKEGIVLYMYGILGGSCFVLVVGIVFYVVMGVVIVQVQNGGMFDVSVQCVVIVLSVKVSVVLQLLKWLLLMVVNVFLKMEGNDIVIGVLGKVMFYVVQYMLIGL